MSNFILAIILVLLTILVHTVVSVITYSYIQKKGRAKTKFLRFLDIDLVIIAILLATIVESMGWAFVYVYKGSFSSFEEALYFSLVSYTTLGYGDIVLHEDHRILGAIEAANGVIMMGWSTALVVALIQKVFINK